MVSMSITAFQWMGEEIDSVAGMGGQFNLWNPCSRLQGIPFSASLRRQLLGFSTPSGSKATTRKRTAPASPLTARLSGVPTSCGLSVVLLPSLRGSQARSRVIYLDGGLFGLVDKDSLQRGDPPKRPHELFRALTKRNPWITVPLLSRNMQ